MTRPRPALSREARKPPRAALEKAVAAELPALKLERAEFKVAIDDRPRQQAASTASTTSTSRSAPIPARGPAR